MIRVLDIHITGKARMTFMEIDDMKQETKTTVKETVPEPAQETVSEIEETESERDKRLKKERLEWQKNHPNKW